MQGLIVHGRIIFKVMSHCSVILNQFAMQKEGVEPVLTDVKFFFHMQQNGLEMLLRLMSVGV